MLGKLTIDEKIKMNILPQNLLKLTLSFLHISDDFYFFFVKIKVKFNFMPPWDKETGDGRVAH